MNRIRIVPLLGALLALSVTLAACGGSDGDADPQEVVAGATLQGVESGKFDVSIRASSKGKSGGQVDASLSGAFEKEAEADLPQLDLTFSAQGKADGEDIDFEAGLTLLEDRAYVGYEGTEYEVDPTTFSYVKSTIEGAQQQNPEKADPAACQEALAEIDFSSVFKNAKNEGDVEVAGQETTKVSAEIDPNGVVDLVNDLTEDPSCGAQIKAAGGGSLDQLEEASGQVSEVVKKVDADLYVGDEGIVRRLTVAAVGEDEDGERVSVDFDMTLSEVNEAQEISPPANAKPLEGLFGKLGVNPLALLESSGEDGIAGLLEGVLGGASIEGVPGGALGGGSSSGGASGSGGSNPGGSADSKSYIECLEDAKTASDLQDCAGLAP